MFIVKPDTLQGWQQAMFTLSYYHVAVDIQSDGENSDSVYILVDTKDSSYRSIEEEEKFDQAYRLCEAAFQIYFLQKNEFLCCICRKKVEHTGEGNATCGHLTFTKYIGS